MQNFPDTSHYDMLLRGERSLANALPLINKAEACGIDCTEFKEGHAFMSDRYARYRAVYFPDQVTPGTGTGVPTSG